MVPIESLPGELKLRKNNIAKVQKTFHGDKEREKIPKLLDTTIAKVSLVAEKSKMLKQKIAGFSNLQKEIETFNKLVDLVAKDVDALSDACFKARGSKDTPARDFSSLYVATASFASGAKLDVP
jgi:hypothetical protein